MITNLADYFRPEQEIYLDSITYNRIEKANTPITGEISLVCQDNIQASLNDSGVKIIITRSLNFTPSVLFCLAVTFGMNLKFNEKKDDINWADINLAEEFQEHGAFATVQLLSRISLLIGQITSSFGQPLILPAIPAGNIQPK